METDREDQVLLKINMKNETGKYFISLDKPDQTAYPDEKEILLQAGIICDLEKVTKEKVMADEVTVFHLKTSEKLVKCHKLKQKLQLLIPITIYILTEFSYQVWREVESNFGQIPETEIDIN